MGNSCSWMLIAVSTAFASTQAASASETESIQKNRGVESLELLERLAVPEKGSSSRDVRWSGPNSLFLGYEMDGVGEYRVDGGLVLEREIFPPYSATSRMLVWNLAVSASDLHVWSVAHRAAWVPLSGSEPSQITAKAIRGYFDDIDVHGDVVALLGYPNIEQFVESGRSYLWLGDLRSELSQWRPLFRRLQAADTPEVKGALAQFYGSIRFLPNGEILVSPGFQPYVYRVTRAGKEKESWSLAELESSLLRALGGDHGKSDLTELALGERASTRADSKRYLASQRMIVEDVLPLGKTPALLVRYRSSQGVGFYLGVLGPEVSWFELVLGDHPSSVRLRADHQPSSGKLAILATDRNQVEVSSQVVYVFREPLAY